MKKHHKDSSILKSVKLPERITKISSEAYYTQPSLKPIVLPERLTETGPEAYCELDLTEGIKLPDVTEIGDQAYCTSPTLTPIVLPERPREDFCRPKYHNILSQRCKFTGSSDMQKPLILPKDLYKFTCGGLFPFVPVRIPDWPKKALSGLIIPKT